MPQRLYHARQYGQDYYGEYHQREVVFNERHVSKIETAVNESRDPDYTAGYVIDQEMEIVHLAYSGDEGREGPDYRHKTGEYYRAAAVFFEKAVRLVYVFFLYKWAWSPAKASRR